MCKALLHQFIYLFHSFPRKWGPTGFRNLLRITAGTIYQPELSEEERRHSIRRLHATRSKPFCLKVSGCCCLLLVCLPSSIYQFCTSCIVNRFPAWQLTHKFLISKPPGCSDFQNGSSTGSRPAWKWVALIFPPPPDLQCCITMWELGIILQ